MRIRKTLFDFLLLLVNCPMNDFKFQTHKVVFELHDEIFLVIIAFKHKDPNTFVSNESNILIINNRKYSVML